MRAVELRALVRVAFVTLCLGACAQLDVVPAERLHGQALSDHGETLAHIRARNSGWFLLNAIPLVSGDLSNPSYPQFPRFFRNHVTIDRVLAKVARTSQELGGDELHDTVSSLQSHWFTLTLVFWFREVEVSANVIKRKPAR